MNARRDYAGFPVRALALLIDSVILLIITSAVISLFDNRFIEAVAGLLIQCSYYSWFVAGAWQATPGKRAVNIHVIHRSGRALTEREAVARFLAYTMPTLPAYSSMDPQAMNVMVMWLLLIWFLPAFMTRERTAIHDILCDTRVVTGSVNKGSL